MPQSPYAKLLCSVDGGANQSGAITATIGQTLQFSIENATGVTQGYRWVLYDFPPDMTVPSGWSTAADGSYYSLASVPDPVTVTHWGKIMPALYINGATRTSTNPAWRDESTGIKTTSPVLGMPGISALEAQQFETRGYPVDFMRSLAAIETFFGGSFTLTKSASYEVTTADYPSSDSKLIHLKIIVDAAATISLPNDASRQVGTTITIAKDDGFHVLTISGNGASIQTGVNGQTNTQWVTRGNVGRGRSESYTYMWDGALWVLLGAPGGLGERVILSSTRDATPYDAGKVLHCDGGTVVYTVDADTFDDGDRVDFLFTGSSGSLTIAEGTGDITINYVAAKSLGMSTRYTQATLLCYGSRGDTPQLHVLTGELD